MDVSPEMQARLDQARAWLDSHMVKPPTDLARMMRASGAGYMGDLDGLSPDQWEFSPGENEWSPKELCLHMAHATSGMAGCVPILAGGHTLDVDLQPGELGEDPGSYETLLVQLNGAFGEAVGAMKSLEDNPDENATMKHPFLGPLNCREWAAFNILHTDIHRRQLQRIKGCEGYPSQ